MSIGEFRVDADSDYRVVDLPVGADAWDEAIHVLRELRPTLTEDRLTFLLHEPDGQGVGERILNELKKRAKLADCSILDLDSGVQRYDAHRFYLRERMSISAHHFAYALR